LDEDIAFAAANGATVIIAPNDNEMYPDGYQTFLDQAPCYQRMDAQVVPFLYRGMMTMSFRWVNALRPHRSYWGLKDFGQTLLLERAVRDFMLPVTIVRVPCVRNSAGVPVSSRLAPLDPNALEELARLYRALLKGFDAVKRGERKRSHIRSTVLGALSCEGGMQRFEIRYVDVFDAIDFSAPDEISDFAVLHSGVTGLGINHFDGILIDL
jgi:pantoate--beta-alanine ligase